MSTREEILAALLAHPQGLTSKELAPLCPAGECDEIVVGRQIAQLRAENLIHTGTAFREGGGTIWLHGPTPNAPTEERVPLETPRPATASVAAKAIAAMRPRTSVPEPQAPQESATMTKKTVAERCIDALKKHGRLTIKQLAIHAQSTVGSLYTIGAQLKKLGAVKVAPGVYDMAGTAAAKVSAAAPRQKGTKKPRKAREIRREPPAPQAKPANGHPQFAINEGGELGIETAEAKVRLSPDAFTRLRDFIERTKPIWEPA